MKIRVSGFDAEILSTLFHLMRYMPPPQNGELPRRINNYSKNPCPPCLGETLRRGFFVERRFSWFWCESDEFMPVSSENQIR
jgi:hypothetical protein